MPPDPTEDITIQGQSDENEELQKHIPFPRHSAGLGYRQACHRDVTVTHQSLSVLLIHNIFASFGPVDVLKHKHTK